MVKSLANEPVTVMVAYVFFHIASEVWLLKFPFLFFKKLLNTYQLRLILLFFFSRVPFKKSVHAFQRFLSAFFSIFRLLPFMPYLVLERKTGKRRREKTWLAENKHTHVQSNVHHIFKHISKSSDFEIISQNKFSILSRPCRFFI